MEKRQIRMIAFDMDGTVLYDKNEISPKLQGILKKALDQGIYVVPCTGRGLCEMPRTLTALGLTHTATANGALVRDEKADQVLYRNLIPWEMAAEIYHELKKIECYVTVHIDGRVYFKGESEEAVRAMYKLVDYIPVPVIWDAEALVREKQEDLEKIYARARTPEEFERIMALIKGKYPLFYSSSAVGNMEFSALDCSKGTALAWLCDHLGVDPSQVVAFGDGENDKEMLRFAGIGVAMGNGNEICKAAADVVIGNCADDAVAYFLEELLGY
ncbi:MAG: HAD family phosphatase [Lachnospiraceae bacterium]|nr:HAD family phosphatase [Lachnospiraceae bacterium]